MATRREDSADARIAALARELASAINESGSGGRIEQRDLAIEVLRDSVETDLAGEAGDAAPGRDAAAPVNPFALGIPVSMAGLALAFIFPPVGAVLLGVGLLACGLGLVLAITRSLFRGRRSGASRPGKRVAGLSGRS